MLEKIRYEELSDSDRAELIRKYHVNGDYSIARLAEECGTYSNKLRRDAVKFGIKLEDRAAAQKKALKTGAHKHPTKGKKFDEKVKEKISDSQREAWKNTPDKEKKRISKERKKLYKKQKVKMHDQPAKIAAIQKAAKIGSKLERFLAEGVGQKYKVTHQKEDSIKQEKFHIDIFLEANNIAIEVDGPNHYANIWGDEALEKTKTKDLRKRSAMLELGYKIINVINDRKFSPAYGREVLGNLLDLIYDIIHKRVEGKEFICRV